MGVLLLLVNRTTLMDLTARVVDVDESDVEILSIETARNYGYIPPPEIYIWKAKTPKGTYKCRTNNGYEMAGSGFQKGGNCYKLRN